MSRIFKRIENFNKAFDMFDEMQKNYLSDKMNNAYRLALTQSFEIVCELAWKVLKDYLLLNNIEVQTPKDTVKKAFNSNIIENGQIWIDMVNDRNATSHEYNLEKVDLILEKIAATYYEELIGFKKWLRGFDAK